MLRKSFIAVSSRRLRPLVLPRIASSAAHCQLVFLACGLRAWSFTDRFAAVCPGIANSYRAGNAKASVAGGRPIQPLQCKVRISLSFLSAAWTDDLDVHTHGLEDIVLDPASYPALLFRSRSSD